MTTPTDRNSIRQVFNQAWKKFNDQQPLSALETQLVAIIQNHPEYITVVEQLDKNIDKDYSTDTNPFLHLSLHLSLQEQLCADRPKGIKQIYTSLLQKHADPHQVEHLMMDVMANILWDAQQGGVLADESGYLNQLNNL